MTICENEKCKKESYVIIFTKDHKKVCDDCYDEIEKEKKNGTSK